MQSFISRKAFESEADGDKEMEFSEATKRLIFWTIAYLGPIGFGLSCVGLFIAHEAG